MPTTSPLLRATPLLFTLLWSSGWVVAGYSALYADALTFLTVRFAVAAIVLGVIARVGGAAWPATPRAWAHCVVTGVLLHAIYLDCLWWAVRQGLPAGISGLIAGLQPVLTALLAPLLAGERISRLRWAGIACGFLGIGLVLQPKLAGLDAATLWPVLIPVLVNAIGMVSVTLGSFYQRAKIVSGDLRTVTAIQFGVAFLVTLPFAWLLEPMRIEWNATMALVLGWSVLVLSVGGTGLYLFMLRRGEIARVTTFLYLVPALVAFETWLLFGETLTPIQLLGMAVTVLGVALASRR